MSDPRKFQLFGILDASLRKLKRDLRWLAGLTVGWACAPYSWRSAARRTRLHSALGRSANTSKMRTRVKMAGLKRIFEAIPRQRVGRSRVLIHRQRIGPGVVLLGRPNEYRATGFVISRKHRLVATAAHVADLAFLNGAPMQAVPSGTSVVYDVEGVYYHPALVRNLDQGLCARSTDPADGEVAFAGPDVAVLRLSRGGPELPTECELRAGK